MEDYEIVRFPTDTEIRYVNSSVDKTTFLTGARDTEHGTLEIMMLRNHTAENENPKFIASPIRNVLIMKPKSEVAWWMETIHLDMWNEYSGETVGYLITADMVNHPLWTEQDEQEYGPLCDACLKNYNMKYGDGNGIDKPSELDENGEGVCFENGAWKAVINLK
jgi:hypothetical protein